MPSREGGNNLALENTDGALSQQPAVKYGYKMIVFFNVTEES
jgi:hypothetical protein